MDTASLATQNSLVCAQYVAKTDSGVDPLMLIVHLTKFS